MKRNAILLGFLGIVLLVSNLSQASERAEQNKDVVRNNWVGCALSSIGSLYCFARSGKLAKKAANLVGAVEKEAAEVSAGERSSGNPVFDIFGAIVGAFCDCPLARKMASLNSRCYWYFGGGVMLGAAAVFFGANAIYKSYHRPTHQEE